MSFLKDLELYPKQKDIKSFEWSNESKYNRKHGKTYKIGSKFDPVLIEAKKMIENYWEIGEQVKFTELAKKLNVARDNLLKRTMFLINTKVLIQTKNRKYIRWK